MPGAMGLWAYTYEPVVPLSGANTWDIFSQLSLAYTQAPYCIKEYNNLHVRGHKGKGNINTPFGLASLNETSIWKGNTTDEHA
jgi:hypothetical protein